MCQATVSQQTALNCAAAVGPLVMAVRHGRDQVRRYCIPSCDWVSRRVDTAFPPAIGSHAG
eukprot:78011-Prorocentrum_minimum.AAC.2